MSGECDKCGEHCTDCQCEDYSEKVCMTFQERSSRIIKLSHLLKECAHLNEKDDLVISGAFGFIISQFALFMTDEDYNCFVKLMTKSRNIYMESKNE